MLFSWIWILCSEEWDHFYLWVTVWIFWHSFYTSQTKLRPRLCTQVLSPFLMLKPIINQKWARPPTQWRSYSSAKAWQSPTSFVLPLSRLDNHSGSVNTIILKTLSRVWTHSSSSSFLFQSLCQQHPQIERKHKQPHSSVKWSVIIRGDRILTRPRHQLVMDDGRQIQAAGGHFIGSDAEWTHGRIQAFIFCLLSLMVNSLFNYTMVTWVWLLMKK